MFSQWPKVTVNGAPFFLNPIELESQPDLLVFALTGSMDSLASAEVRPEGLCTGHAAHHPA